MKKHIYYPRTTASQREVLFERWQETKDVRAACQKARVSERTFYYWKPRFEAKGYEALPEFQPLGAKKGSRTPPAVEEKVIKMRQANQKWGKRRIADELSKENNWVSLVSPNTVKRILEDAGLWEPEETRSGSKKVETVSRTAEEPGQTVNIDMCFVPAEHEAEVKLPAVSGSSGKLVVEQPKTEPSPYPGLIFADEKLAYEEAMRQFVTASQSEETVQGEKSPAEVEKMAVKAKKKR